VLVTESRHASAKWNEICDWSGAIGVLVTDQSKEQLRREVLNYFLCHPSAAETLEGVTRWRLRQAIIDRTVEETNEVLEELIRQGFLEELKQAATAPLFPAPARKTGRGGTAHCFY
jgi:hypothetical protein